ncbi:MAG: GntR family transcriptional regulator, partial [Alphaproteobacteria bacterium]|nr:GntR family transcriptional regulator [Alphaproteobacteria bacterium]
HGRRGLVVAPVDARHLRHLYEVRAALDGVAARLAATEVAAGRLAAAAVATLHAIVARGEEAARAGDATALVAADAAFHRFVNEMSGNPVLIETAEKQWLHMRRAMGAVVADPTIRARIWREHAAIADAIAAGDTARAEEQARNHAARAGAEAHARLAEAAELMEETT